MVEIFTIGGGDYLVNVFQAVAAWTGNGGYKSLLQVVMVMGLGLSALTLALNQDWRAWINWFLGATLIYSCLMVPRLDVHVTDRLNPSLAPANVSNVPLGLALMASFTSQVGDYLTGSAEVVFGLPGDLNYSKNGMIYGARLYDATRSLRISDPEFAANLDEHFRQCVFYDVLLGRYSMKQLAESNDIWATIAPGSQARAQRFLTRDATSGQVTSSIVTCREAYDALNNQWTGLVDDMGTVFGRQLYPNQTAALAKAKLFADLPVAYQYLSGVSANATEIFKQTLTINAMSQAMHSMAGGSGASSVDVYSQTRADIQTERTYSSIASNAMKWVPLLNIVLTVLFYALFPVLFPLFLLPKSGPVALKGYITGFFYLAAWGPLFVILHMMLMYKGATDMTAVTARLSTMASQARLNSESYANVATESTASAVTRFRELRDQFSRGSAFESATGTSNSDSIQTAFNEVDQASTNLQRQFGLSRRAADDITVAWFLNGEAGASAGVTNGVASANIGAKGGRNQAWTDSDIGIASEDRSRIFGSLAQMSDSRNWSSTRDGFVRSVSTSSSSSISTSASGMNASLTEAQSYSREARRAEELANRLESQASFFKGNSASGSLNLSQAYREWGLVEIERNRDYYGNVRFDDVTFQLSPEGQALQGKFIESFAEQLRNGIEDRLVLAPGQPVSRPAIYGAGSVRGRAQTVGGGSGTVPQVDAGNIHDEVQGAQATGRQKISGSRGRLDAVTKGAQGASAEAADDVKEW